MEKCKKCESDNLDLGRAKNSAGAEIFPIYCKDCGDVSTQYIKKKIALDYEKNNGKLADVKTRTNIMREDIKYQIECAVCKKPEGELHHFAPFHLFGEECERWPTAYLCRPCHKRWHDLVTPNMSKKVA